ncbi:uncharacterized protein FA14DRAFT_162765 [Meira miltonrushii]|uniref:Uncharacterized protein n=1 Tax=Meira miltonrushii TaxID=1280837 RepID=A0A316V1T8_9BASI|nr:uncharacterized protein FA14DRAFT_162765 [Meira miltonrushii]PWN31432.1 hypothetical protein FA14DRAFT_162765 [Meira miltonrushii]
MSARRKISQYISCTTLNLFISNCSMKNLRPRKCIPNRLHPPFARHALVACFCKDNVSVTRLILPREAMLDLYVRLDAKCGKLRNSR